MARPPSVAVVGAGAVGLYYGARLAASGKSRVTFHLRSDYEKVVAAGGVEVRSIKGDMFISTKQAGFVEMGSSQETYDWVVVGLKATKSGLRAARGIVEPLLAPSGRVLVLMNGLGIEDCFADWFGPSRIFGGVAYSCINRIAPGVVDHIDYGHIVLGHLLDDEAEVGRAMALWEGSKVDVQPTSDLTLARWRKTMWNVPFNGLACTGGCLTTSMIMSDPELRKAAGQLCSEVAAAGRADVAIRARSRGTEPAMLPAEEEVAAMLEFTHNMRDYRPSTMIDLSEGREMEWEHIFLEPLRRAREQGVAVPCLALLTAQMGALAARNASSGNT